MILVYSSKFWNFEAKIFSSVKFNMWNFWFNIFDKISFGVITNYNIKLIRTHFI